MEAVNNHGRHWRAYVGYMTEPTREFNQREFNIYIPELNPFHDGDISPEYTEIPVSIKNIATGSNECKDVKVTKTVKADFFGFESSKSVPTIAKGQQVIVVNFGSTEKYYWIPLERDDHLKTFERLRFSCVNTDIINKVPADPDDILTKKSGITDENSYYLEIDTADKKLIQLATSASDGEDFIYYLKLDPDEKSIELWDLPAGGGLSNSIKIESNPRNDGNGKIILQNAQSTSIELDGEDLNIVVPGNFTFKVGKDIYRAIGGGMATSIEKDHNLIVGGHEDIAIAGNRKHIIHENDVLDVSGGRMITVEKDQTTEVIGISTEKQHSKLSETQTNAHWKTETFTVNAKASAVNTETLVLVVSESMISDMVTVMLTTDSYTHVSKMTKFTYAKCPMVIISPELGPIPVKSIV